MLSQKIRADMCRLYKCVIDIPVLILFPSHLESRPTVNYEPFEHSPVSVIYHYFYKLTLE